MIALLAAVPLETDLLRRALSPCEVRSCGRLDFYRGTLERHQVVLGHSGVGKANAAAAATILLEQQRPASIICLGCGGAYPGSGLRVGDLALASDEIYGDEGVAAPNGFLDMEALGFALVQRNGHRYYDRFPADQELLRNSRDRIQDHADNTGLRLAVGAFVTVSTGSGTTAAGLALAQRTGGICENMEGAAIAQVCARYGVPFLEIRGISNLTEDRDLARWDLKAGAAAAQLAVRALLADGQRQRDPA
jgi:futalosine hydrolase